MADKNDETPDAGWTADGATAPTENLSDATAAPTAAPAAASEPAASTAPPAAASAPAASAEKPGRARRLLVPGIALVAGLAIGLGGGALLGSALDGPRGFDRAAFVGDSGGDRPGGPAADGPGAGHRDGPHPGGPRGDSDDMTDDSTDDTTEDTDTDTDTE